MTTLDQAEIQQMIASGGLKRMGISAVIRRADGTVENLGEVSATEFTPPQPQPNPLLALAKRIFRC